jgi:nitroreductase
MTGSGAETPLPGMRFNAKDDWLYMAQPPKPEDHRNPEHPIESIFFRRWSPRSMSGEPITEAEMMALFEAARWAPSTYNEQEWRFLYARRDTPQWPAFFELLAERNQAWCRQAALLCVVAAHKVFQRNGNPNRVHVFDCGLAFENLALQGTAMGLVVHGMAGFDFEKAQTSLAVPQDFAIAAMFAVGRPGDPEKLDPDFRKIEVPSGRKHVREFICEGRFAFGR